MIILLSSFLRFRSIKIFVRISIVNVLIYLLYRKVFIKITENIEDQTESQSIHECGCEKEYFYPKNNQNKEIYSSTCSDEGTFHSKEQKVISFALTHQNVNHIKTEHIYLNGIKENLKRIRILYPGYTLRLYTDIVLESKSKYCTIFCENNDFFWCNIHKSPSLGNLSKIEPSIWRFTPLGDETVDIFLSRDLEAYILKREADAVKDWLRASSKSIHLMRDGPNQEHEMEGGMWGASNNRLGLNKAMSLREKILERSNKQLGGFILDRNILLNTLFYKKSKSILAHDSFHCEKWRHFTSLRPFPTKRFVSHNVIGYVGYHSTKQVELEKCPVECRPSYGMDWEYC